MLRSSIATNHRRATPPENRHEQRTIPGAATSRHSRPRPEIPEDLVQAQRDWYATYRQLADSSGTQTAALRRHLLQLSAQIAGHPFWARVCNEPAARMALKQTTWSTVVR